MQDKRGLSAIVATLILILLVLVAAGIIWVVIRNIIAEGAEGIELGRFTLDLSIKSAYIDDPNVKVNVRRSSGEGDLVGVRFVFFNGTDSISVDRKTPLVQTQEKLFSFDSVEVGNIYVLQEVSIAPIYKLSSGKERIGEITDTATISGASIPGTGDPGTGSCGDGTIQSPNGDGDYEVCDGTNLGGEDCISQGFDTGDLECSIDCLSFDVSSCTEVSASCDGVWNQIDIDAGTDCDAGANCLSDCTCSVGFTPDGVGGCDLNPPVTGTINTVWNNIFFDSQDLPIDSTITDFIGDYINFSGGSVETDCFLITFAAYLEDNGISYLRLDDSFGAPNINAGEEYDVWEAENCGA